jgi:hypothetical protein
LHAWVIPQQVSIPEASRQFDENGDLKDPEIRSRLLQLGEQVARFTALHNASASVEFLQQWQSAPENPGGRSR